MRFAAVLVLIACTAAAIAQGQLEELAANKAAFLSFLASQGSVGQVSNGLSLEGTSLKTYTPPSENCISDALALMPGCQPFLQAISASGGQLSAYTVLELLMLSKNTTSTASCVTATMTFFNDGCVCSTEVLTVLKALPDSTVPAIAKTSFQLLNELKCPPAPAAAPTDAAGRRHLAAVVSDDDNVDMLDTASAF